MGREKDKAEKGLDAVGPMLPFINLMALHNRMLRVESMLLSACQQMDSETLRVGADEIRQLHKELEPAWGEYVSRKAQNKAEDTD